MDNEIFDIIISLVKAYDNEIKGKDKPYIKTNYNNEERFLLNCHYLLNQVLRQINITKEKYFISEEAYDLWQKLNLSGIHNRKESRDYNDFYYQEKMTAHNDEPVKVKIYHGNSKKEEIKIMVFIQ